LFDGVNFYVSKPDERVDKTAEEKRRAEEKAKKEKKRAMEGSLFKVRAFFSIHT
jgi:hypothetical protein